MNATTPGRALYEVIAARFTDELDTWVDWDELEDHARTIYEDAAQAAIAAQQPQARSGQAVYEIWRAAIPDWVCNVPGGPWEGLPETVRAGFNAIAAQIEAAGQVVRDILESLCRRDGLPLESAVVPGEPAGNYELAGRLGIGHVFGLPGEAPASPQPAPELAAAMAPMPKWDDLSYQDKLMLAALGDTQPQAAPELAAAPPDLRTAWRLADERLALLSEILGHPGIGQVPAGLRAKWHERAGLPS